MSEPQTPPSSQCTHMGHTVTVAAVCLEGSCPSSGPPGAKLARALQQALLQGWRAPAVLPTAFHLPPCQAMPSPTHSLLFADRLAPSGRLCRPTCPAQQNMVPPCPLPWGGLEGAPQKGCSAERLNVGSIHAAEGFGCLPRGRASALQTSHDLWPVVGVRDCPLWSRSRALSLGLEGDTGWGSGLSPQAEPRVRSLSGLLFSLSA